MKTILAYSNFRRKYTTFKLKKNELVEVDGDSYRATRVQFRKLFRQRFDEEIFLNYGSVGGPFDDYMGTATRSADKAVFGCMEFTGENFRRLRAWALKKA